MNNEQIHQKFLLFGKNARMYVRKCIALLPAVYEKKIYKEKGFNSIFEYAAKLGGISHEQLKRALSLDERFKKTPVLKKMLRNGEVSINKLARITSIATPENQKELAEKIKSLPQKAIETLVRDEKQFVRAHKSASENQMGIMQGAEEESESRQEESQQAKLQSPSSLHSPPQLQGPNLDMKLAHKLSAEVKQKLAELDEKGIDINELLLELLQKREQEIAEEKEKLSKEAKPTKSTYIKVNIKKILQKEHGTKCSIPGCNKPATNLHHTRRFALSHTHDPKYLAPLCKEHHQIAHTIDKKVNYYSSLHEAYANPII